jgi:hypothetical protein
MFVFIDRNFSLKSMLNNFIGISIDDYIWVTGFWLMDSVPATGYLTMEKY